MQIQIEVQDSTPYDVIVVGAGPAGIAAAVTAGRNGAKTLLIEEKGRLGGMSTAGLVNQFVGTVGNPLYHAIRTRLAEMDPHSSGQVTKYIDPEALTLVYLAMLSEAGVSMMLYTRFCKAHMEGNRVAGVICHGKEGFTLFRAHTVVDATGDGDVAAEAGATFTLGRETDGRMQPASLLFRVGGVDMERAVFPDDFGDAATLQALGKQHLPPPAGHVLLHRSTIPGVVSCNMTNATGIDGTKAEDLTRAELTCRQQIPKILEFLRKYVPGYEACYLLDTASQIGIRESRHFHGEAVLTEEEIREARAREDYVVYGADFLFDIHNVSGAGLDEQGDLHKGAPAGGYTIPYACLIPKGIDGLLLAGRCISGTHIAHASFRAMPICIGIGEAAGAAAALCTKRGLLPREISALDVRRLIGADRI